MSENRIAKDRIFVGGSIVVKALPETIKNVLDCAMDNRVDFVIGDAPGVDSLVQTYLRAAQYPHVTIYAMRFARNNVGKWPVKTHQAPPGVTGSAWHAVKDRAMANDATSGIMIWNGASSGTRNNVLNLLRLGKPCTVWSTGFPTELRTYFSIHEFPSL